MDKMLDGVFDLFRHGEIGGAIGAVPPQCKAKELGASPVGGDFAEVVETVGCWLCWCT